MTIPSDQGCCGIPSLASGDRDSFTRLVDHNLALFEKQPFDVLVTACATCTSTIKKLWPSVYKNPSSGMQKKLTALSGKNHGYQPVSGGSGGDRAA
ncbi:MAG: heterodisulfide reductase-related iron-sulfur binding cluster [Desulfotignum sp.]|nr:heterodisulfide reductase-related iron-sulfur binding cluster [Desulfotignum sp.]